MVPQQANVYHIQDKYPYPTGNDADGRIIRVSREKDAVHQAVSGHSFYSKRMESKATTIERGYVGQGLALQSSSADAAQRTPLFFAAKDFRPPGFLAVIFARGGTPST